MCGIAVVVGPNREDVGHALQGMLAAQTHRGPDDEGRQFVELPFGRLALGQRRLSIIDLSQFGHQPMVHEPSGDMLVYNGELYNFLELRTRLEAMGEQFNGRSDTEVMLAALVRWGTPAFSMFRGMLAVAWFRRQARKLVLARDPVGIKPLYYAQTSAGFCAASEVRAIAASGFVQPSISPRALGSLLAFGAVQEPDTILSGVSAFPAGSFMEISLDQPLEGKLPAPQRYWRFPKPDPAMTEKQAIERVRSIMDTSVREHLISDVPLGVFLSSGIDSTVVAGLASRHADQLSSYTVGLADHPDMSEAGPAAETARLFGLAHHDVNIPPGQVLCGVKPWLDALDQPSIDGLNTYIVSRAVKQAGLTVALSGLGGDEMFAGYSSFGDVPKLRSMMQQVRFVPRQLRVMLARLAAVGRPVAYRHKLIDIARCDGSLLDMYFQRRRVMSSLQLAELGLHADALGLTPAFMPPEAVAALDLPADDPVACVSILETTFYTGNMLLRDSDADGMAHSLEIRVPFFDTRVIEAAAAIPGPLRAPEGKPPKHLLREAFPDLLRPALRKLGKRGFALPIARWMSGDLREMCESSLSALSGLGLLEARAIDRMWHRFLAEPESPIWSRAFALVVLGSYIERVVTRSRPNVKIHARQAISTVL